MPGKVSTKSNKKISQQQDNSNWLFSGIDQLSTQFDQMVPRQIREQYVERLKKEGQFTTIFQQMEAMRAFRLYFVALAMDEQIAGLLVNGELFNYLKKGGQINLPTKSRHVDAQIVRHYTESTAKLHKVLSEVLEKNGFSVVAGINIGQTGDDPLSKIVDQIQDDDTEEFDVALSIHKKRKKQKAEDPNQTNLLGNQEVSDLSEAEYEELRTPVNEE